MSWSIKIAGNAKDVTTQAQAELAKFAKLEEPEASLKSEVGQLIALALGNAPRDAQVEVHAGGSQTLINPDRPGDGARTNLFVNIKTV